jgi:hypothetical protein
MLLGGMEESRSWSDGFEACWYTAVLIGSLESWWESKFGKQNYNPL